MHAAYKYRDILCSHVALNELFSKEGPILMLAGFYGSTAIRNLSPW